MSDPAEAPSSGPRPYLLICPATGVPGRFYAGFAAAARARGYTVGIVTYTPDRDLEHWITQDIPGAIDALHRAAAPAQAPVYVVGHSLGAQALGLAGPWDRVQGVVRVAASTGYVWKTRQPLRHAWRLLVVMRLAALLIGRLPARLSGLGQDLTRQQVLTWARWCGRPGYFHAERLAGSAPLVISVPVLDIFALDDPYATPANRQDLNRFYSFAQREEIGLTDALGHVGFFRRGNAALWEHVFAWMEENERRALA